MATYGIRITNPQGDVLIDGERPHPVLHYEVNFTLPQSPYPWGGGGIAVSFPPTNLPLMFAFFTEDAQILPFYVERDGAGNYHRINVLVPLDHPGGRTATMRVYTAGTVGTPTSDHGIEAFGRTGERIFHSDMKTLRVHHMDQITIPYNGSAWAYFPPTKEKPFIHLSTKGYVNFYWTLGADWVYHPFFGPVEKNANGEYYRFRVAGMQWWSPKWYLNLGISPWTMPWVVFV